MESLPSFTSIGEADTRQSFFVYVVWQVLWLFFSSCQLRNDAVYNVCCHAQLAFRCSVEFSASLRYIYCIFVRLLVQLDETSSNFETFWTNHKRRLEQCLQLRHFEEQFKQVSI
jgi:hypothetical protein